MKKSIVLSLALIIISISAFSQVRKITNTAFKRGELIRYKVYYDAILTGKVVAGEAELEVKNENKLEIGRA
ncbi:MAG: hypothetical protein HGA42_12400, partial [Nostocales cyanobacterium W4_Combined_metabat2_030]|nr:hypothetical protein [Nostocales cyanobacterium W4_Combined_metabat2_030]